MNATTRRALGLASFLAIATLPALAMAADIPRIDAAELAQLSPPVAAQVKAQAIGGNTIGGVMETMLLNSMPASLSAKRMVAVDFRKAVVVFETNDGTLKSVPFDTATLKVKP
jgi:predicted cobalt transporter CbtA